MFVVDSDLQPGTLVIDTLVTTSSIVDSAVICLGANSGYADFLGGRYQNGA